jgi:transcriptional regulator with XRE-family HTH domain
MELYKKIKVIRLSKSWTQEEMANKLGISPQAYAKIERGKTDAKFSRLQQIADVMEIDLPKLLGLDEKNILNLTGDHITQCEKFDNRHVNSTEQTECKHELEKARLIIEQREKEIDYLKQEIAMLKQQISDFRNIINLLKKPEKPEE